MTDTAPGIAEIADLCRTYARAREALEQITEAIARDRRQAVRRKLRVLKTRVAETSAARETLRAAVEASPGLFEKPRTRAIEGIKVGFRKQPGAIVVTDEDRAIALIRKRLADRSEVLIRTKESIDKAALRKLEVKELAAIGATLTDDEDEVVVAAASTDLDRLVDALLDDGDEDAGT